ncbi:MAG: hypothetical protein RLZZ399_560 [Verrucomicrobiota bacterium]|jgi:glycosyltransferase involved in cell wall biosynthesis
MRRVAIFSSAFAPSLGGVEELVRQLSLQLERDGVQSVVCTNRWPRNLPEREKMGGVEVWRFPFRMPWGGFRAKVSFPLSAPQTVREIVAALRIWKAELVHVQCVSSNGWYGMQAAKNLGLPLVVSVQGERTMDADQIYQRSPLFNRLLRACLMRADQITACSRATLDDLERYTGGAVRERCRVVYNGVGEEAFEPGAVWPHPRPYLLAVGRLVRQKGFSELLKAFAQGAPSTVDLLLAGDGPEATSLKTLSGQLGIQGRVHFVGRADRRVVTELLRGCRGLVVPSLREPMGIVALEGMAAGRPILASDVDGLREIVALGDRFLLVPPGNTERLAEGLQWICEERSGEAEGNREAAKKFRWPSIARQYLRTYQDVPGWRGASSSTDMAVERAQPR